LRAVGPLFFGFEEILISPANWQRLKNLASEVATREGCQLYDIEFISGRTLRVFIDRQDRTIGIDDCSNVSKGLNDVLDSEDLIPGGAYELEVSSPGLERVLKEPWHFTTALNKTVRLNLKDPVTPSVGENAPTKSVTGQLVQATDLDVRIQEASREWILKLDNVAKARVVFAEAAGKKHPKKR